MSDSLLARKYVDGIYIPLGLLVVGTAIVKIEWTGYALILGLVLGSIKFFNNRAFPSSSTSTLGADPDPGAFPDAGR